MSFVSQYVDIFLPLSALFSFAYLHTHTHTHTHIHTHTHTHKHTQSDSEPGPMLPSKRYFAISVDIFGCHNWVALLASHM